MKIAVVGDLDMTMGFRLAGLEDVYEVKNAEDALNTIRELDNRGDIGLIITTERLGEEIRDSISNLKKFIVEVPDKNGAIIREHDPVKTLVRKAVGVELK